MSTVYTGGLPYDIILLLNKSYTVTTNIDVADGLANGVLGTLDHIECDDNKVVKGVWLEFPSSPKIGEK